MLVGASLIARSVSEGELEATRPSLTLRAMKNGDGRESSEAQLQSRNLLADASGVMIRLAQAISRVAFTDFAKNLSSRREFSADPALSFVQRLDEPESCEEKRQCQT